MAQTYDMTKVHEANLKILKELDRICRSIRSGMPWMREP